MDAQLLELPRMQKGRDYPQVPNHWKSASCFPQHCAPYYFLMGYQIDTADGGIYPGEVSFWSVEDPWLDSRIHWSGEGTLNGQPTNVDCWQEIPESGINFRLRVLLTSPFGTFEFLSESVGESNHWQPSVEGLLDWKVLQAPPEFTILSFSITVEPFDWLTVPDNLLPWS